MKEYNWKDLTDEEMDEILDTLLPKLTPDGPWSFDPPGLGTLGRKQLGDNYVVWQYIAFMSIGAGKHWLASSIKDFSCRMYSGEKCIREYLRWLKKHNWIEVRIKKKQEKREYAIHKQCLVVSGFFPWLKFMLDELETKTMREIGDTVYPVEKFETKKHEGELHVIDLSPQEE